MKTCRKGLHQYDSVPKGCPKCNKTAIEEWRKINAKKIKSYNAEMYKLNSDKIKSRAIKWQKENPEITRERNAAYKRANSLKIREKEAKYKRSHAEQTRVNISVYKKKNSNKVNALNAKRRAAKLKRTPPWLKETHYKEMEALYSLAKELGALYDTKLEVDHIIPLQGENVSGLHVPWNLQVLTASENARKGNSYDIQVKQEYLCHNG